MFFKPELKGYFLVLLYRNILRQISLNFKWSQKEANDSFLDCWIVDREKSFGYLDIVERKIYENTEETQEASGFLSFQVNIQKVLNL